MDPASITGVDPTSAIAQAYAVRCDKLAQSQDQAAGQSAVALIQAAATPPPPSDGKGANLNLYA